MTWSVRLAKGLQSQVDCIRCGPADPDMKVDSCLVLTSMPTDPFRLFPTSLFTYTSPPSSRPPSVACPRSQPRCALPLSQGRSGRLAPPCCHCLSLPVSCCPHTPPSAVQLGYARAFGLAPHAPCGCSHVHNTNTKPQSMTTIRQHWRHKAPPRTNAH